ncbi:MAG: glycosyltransferase [Methylococcaceae bacterium]|nr:glycosyltransferase [Methylococcaceae bacterium]
MRIVIDLQGAQTQSRFRGIGRYTISLTQSIVRHKGEHEVLIVLNGLFPHTIEPIRAAFNGLLPQENIRVWYAPGPVRECDQGNTWRREVAEHLREAFLASLEPDIIHISSLFEGYEDDAVTSIGMFAPHIPTTVTLFDLIPLLNPDTYLKVNPIYEQHYLRKIGHLKRANSLLAISDYSAREGRVTLGFKNESVVNISTACDSIFKVIDVSSQEEKALCQRFGLTKPFVMYSGGADTRKNLHRLIRAYSMLHPDLRETHQLIFVGNMYEGHIHALQATAHSVGLNAGELMFTGYVSDEELLRLYNLCKLFVFPSWHEGFGLPALEAMSCGAAVIGSSTSSVPEVIGRDDALFDPNWEELITRKLTHALTDEDFRIDLTRHGLEQAKKFSWDESGRHAIAAFERLHAERKQTKLVPVRPARRLKLAFVSPLPPERTGIADYSAELLPELARHYDIEVVVAQDHVADPWVQANCELRNPEWLRANGHRVDRVLYHFGNSPFHEHMFELLKEVPGTVVLHDFFLSGLLAHLEMSNQIPNRWSKELYHAHGYKAMRERYCACSWDELVDKVLMKYPVNLSVLQDAQGVIVHSEHSRRLASLWAGDVFARDWAVIPLLREPNSTVDRASACQALGLNPDDFVVCSFGLLAQTKLNHRLLEAWLSSALSRDERCMLVFVGENHGGDYGAQLLQTIRTSGVGDRIRITGWVDTATFRHYLAAANVAVQLRTLSRGETSAAVLDCMNYGLPTIVNANGSMADLPQDAVWMLPDEFDDTHLIEALESLLRNVDERTALGARAQSHVFSRHAPSACAKQYVNAIENFHAKAQIGTPGLIRLVAKLDGHQTDDMDYLALAQSIAQNTPLKQASRQLLIDVSATCRTDLKTGIERVARALAMELLGSPPRGYRIEPVYLTDEGGRWHYRYARRYTLELLGCPLESLADEVVEAHNGDVLLGVDLSGQMLTEADKSGLYDRLSALGVTIHFVVYDLLPVLLPHVFPPGADDSHARWLQTIAQFDGALCISKAVADNLSDWLNAYGPKRLRPFKIGWFHLGADVENSAPTRGLPEDAAQVLRQIAARPSFLMVGTIEPRKGYLQTIEAFTQLWQEGVDVNLVIVGKEGWKGLPDELRRTIPETVGRLCNHSALGKRLFWLEGISDEYLEKIYAASTCLIAASENEGFGLPLIEAAQHKLPIIARDIPVFCEVACEHAYYFNGQGPRALARAVKAWFVSYKDGQYPRSDAMLWLTWKQSAEHVKQIIFEGEWYSR